ncbi:MAG: hypothetical protein NVS3B20_09790 [Polyangiales bacterium]
MESAISTSAPTPRVIGLVADDVREYAQLQAGSRPEIVAFDAPRGPRVSPRAWLETVAAIAGCNRREVTSVADAIFHRAGFGASTPTMIGFLDPAQRAALAIAEVAVAIAHDPASAMVIVPQPPLPMPYRNDLRRLSTMLLDGAEVVLHALAAWELLPLMDPEFIINASGESIAPPDGSRTLLLRVFGRGEPYRAFRSSLEAKGVLFAGGPIAHVLAAPKAIGPSEVLAAAFEAQIDLLEVRDAFEATARG